MPTPTVITDLITTAASNFPSGSDQPSSIDDTIRAHGAFIAQLRDGIASQASVAAHATTSNFFTAKSTQLTGAAVTFTSCVAAPAAGYLARVENTQANTWTDGATFEMQGDRNFTAEAGDICWVYAKTTTTFRVFIEKASGLATHSLSAGVISGMTVSNNVTDATNDINIAAGYCRDSTDVVWINKSSAVVKQLDAGWAAGTNQGMRNSAAAITDTTYHIYAVCKAGGAEPDYYAHTSTNIATVLSALQAETGGSAYIYARWLFPIIRSTSITPFLQTGNVVMWQTQKPDVTAAANTSVTNRTLTIPLGFKFEVIMGAGAFSSGSVNSTLVCDPDLTNRTASTNATNLYNESGVSAACEIRCMSNTSSQVSTHGTGTGALISIRTLGFVIHRGITG